MTILDPCVSAVEPPGYRPYELGNEMDVWVKRADGVTPAQGKVWPAGACYFADYSKNSTREWWKILIKEFHDNMLEFDALWIVSETMGAITVTNNSSNLSYLDIDSFTDLNC